MIRDFTDEEARRALRLKWGLAAADEIPAWVAEMDYRVAEPITEALAAAVADGVTGLEAAAVVSEADAVEDAALAAVRDLTAGTPVHLAGPDGSLRTTA